MFVGIPFLGRILRVIRTTKRDVQFHTSIQFQANLGKKRKHGREISVKRWQTARGHALSMKKVKFLTAGLSREQFPSSPQEEPNRL
eukprot:5868151-Amphidinium_carterae.1